MWQSDGYYCLFLFSFLSFFFVLDCCFIIGCYDKGVFAGQCLPVHLFVCFTGPSFGEIMLLAILHERLSFSLEEGVSNGRVINFLMTRMKLVKTNFNTVSVKG